MNTELFNSMMGDFDEAIKYRRGKKTKARVSRFAPFIAGNLRPADIRKIRTTLGFSQLDFANYLGSSLGSIRSWEQGVRRPQKATLHLLMIAKKKPALLLSARA